MRSTAQCTALLGSIALWIYMGKLEKFIITINYYYENHKHTNIRTIECIGISISYLFCNNLFVSLFSRSEKNNVIIL